MFGSCPRCGSGLHRNLNAIGLTICTSCGWTESRNQSATRVRNENRTMVVMAVSALALLLGIAHSINWGGHALEAPILKLGQLTGTLSPKSYNRLAEICAELGKYSCARSAYIESAQNHRNPEPLAQLDERRGAEGEQRLDRIEDEMIVEDAVAMGAREFPGDRELPHARQTAEDDDPHGVVLPTTHGYAVTLSFTPRLCRTLSTVS